MISIIAPCFNEEEVLPQFYDEVTKVMNRTRYDYEIIFINDGSRDRTLEILRDLSKGDKKVNYISFSRNFGKEGAMLAGLNFSKGDAVIIMDTDLQHPPELIPEMISYFEKGYDQVIAKRNRKGESFFRAFVSKIYYKCINQFVDITLADGVGDFRLLSRQAVNALLSLNEYNRFSKGLFSWIGFKEHMIEFENVNRTAGISKWSFLKLLNYAIDGLVSFNNKPLRIAIYMGLTVTLLDILYVLFMFIKTLLNGPDVPGYFTIIASVSLFGGIQLIFLGLIGEYIGRIYYESKKRPHYIVEEESFTQKSEERQDKHHVLY
ncbi:glycosyltransferase family 2 protein [Paenactinomyces guangxiensis]|uniref:Glycosyltransferase family 2 protein n=1 Tax=Paenactinomyces guangxiensis TaxID=1490290 RepID=A0A7W1WNB8_9BACL|nr:glycosyltransferase family 2 protein [Paenactinomyces guangxiensis]MBA4493056.1 glycosyltransferase family 2 protein [Paenactinomyces guangxiensis]MBH8590095.1 glycosyltransferase family 2 protein [Paenactinomyces guangxiensis]